MQSVKSKKITEIRKERRGYVGVDVSKDKLDLSLLIEGSEKAVFKSFKNQKRGFNSIEKMLSKEKDVLFHIGAESTGPYHLSFINHMTDKGFTTYILNPKKVKDFANSMGYNAKTDKTDSNAIMEYIEIQSKRGKIQPYIKPDKDAMLLKEYSKVRKNLLIEKQQHQNRIGTLNNETKEIKGVYKSIIKNLEKNIKKLEEKMEKLIKKNDDMKEKSKKLNEIKGVGKITIITVLALLPELGRISDKKIVSLVGLAPHPVDSGNYRGKRRIKKGRAGIKPILYMASLSAIKHNEILKEFYQGLLAKGKPKKLALTAVMRKLLIAMNTISRNYIENKEIKNEMEKKHENNA